MTAPHRRSVQNGGIISDNVKRAVWTRDRGRCRECGRELTPGVDIHYDHIVPWAKGGGNEAGNVQLLCTTHNLRKSAKLVVAVSVTSPPDRESKSLSTYERLLLKSTGMDGMDRESRQKIYRAIYQDWLQCQAKKIEGDYRCNLPVEQLLAREGMGDWKERAAARRSGALPQP